MTETRTPRMGQPQWSAGTDSPSRTDFNEAFLNTETRTAYDTGEDYTSLPVTGLVAGRYAMLTVSGDGYSLYRYSGAAWQFVGGSLVARFQRFKAIEGQLITDVAYSVEHPSQVNANIIASYGGDLTAGGVLKSWNANDSAKGALVVGWNGAISLATTGRAYIRSRLDGDLGLVLHAHGAGAGNMLTVREPGNSDILTVDAIGRLQQRTFAAFGGASMPSTSMLAIAPTSAADAIANGLLLHGQSAAPTKDILRVLRDTADTAPIASMGRDGINVGRLPWTASMSTGHVLVSGNRVVLRASGVGGNTVYAQVRRSDPTSAVTEADPSLDTTLVSVGSTGALSDLPLTVTQRRVASAVTMKLHRVSDFTAGFLELSRLVSDGGGGETTQPMSSWDSSGRLRTGLPWRATGTMREVRQSITHVSLKRFTPVFGGPDTGEFIARDDFFDYTWATMTARSADSTDLDISTIVEIMLTQNPDGVSDAQSYAVSTWISVNGGSFTQISTTENAPSSTPTVSRLSGDLAYVNHRYTGLPAGATFQLRTRIALGVYSPEFYLRSLDIKAVESIVESYVAP